MTQLRALNPEEVTRKTKDLFYAVQAKLGVIPNMMRTMGNSPAVLEGYLNLSGALSHGKLGSKTGELIALAVSESNSCEYCLVAHTFIGEKLVKADPAVLQAAKIGNSADAKIEAKRELYMTNKTVKKIAYELGYEDEHYFSLFFKTNADVSPQICRETVGFGKMES